MNDRERDGLNRLQQELEASALPSPELLARFATDPNSLTRDERTELERAMARSPVVVDELDSLRQFDFGALDADRVGAAGARSWLAWLGELLATRPQWVALSMAAAALALWLALGTLPGSPPEEGERVVQGPSPADAPDRSPAPQLGPTPPAPLDPAPGLDRDPLSERASPSALARAPDGARTPESTPRPEMPRPEESLARTPPLPEPPSQREAEAGEAAPRLEESEPILLAMTMPRYQPAFGIETPDGVDWIVRGEGAGSARVSGVGPDHVTRVSRPSPVLHWTIDRLPAEGVFHLTLLDAEDEPVVLDLRLPTPEAPGLQRIDLAELGVAIPREGVSRWSLALRAEPEAAPESFFFGWLRLVPLDGEEAARLEATPPPDRAAFYASLGCFQEALEAALVERDAHPAAVGREQAVTKLLEESAASDRR